MRIFIGFLLSLVAVSVDAAILFEGGFETNNIVTSGNSKTDTFYYASSNAACENKIANYSPSNDVRIVTNPVRSGSYAVQHGIRRSCPLATWQPFNGGGLIKPRTATTVTPGSLPINEGTEYWISFSFYIAEDWEWDYELNPDTIMQLYKEGTRANGANAFNLEIVEDDLVVNRRNTGAGLSNEEKKVTGLTRGQWYDVVLNFRLCKASGSACGNPAADGFIDVYLNYDGAPHTVTDPWWSDTGVNTEDTVHKYTAQIYKYAGWCRGTDRNSVSACNANPNPSNWTNFRKLYLDEIRVGDSSSSLSEVAPDFEGAAPAPETQITRCCLDDITEPDDYPVYFTTTGGTNGVYSITYGDGISTESAPAWNSNANGGTFEMGAAAALSGGPLYITMLYDTPDYDADTASDKPLNWSKFNVSTASYTPPDAFGGQNAITITNTTSGNGRISLPVGSRPSVTSGESCKVLWVLEEGTSGGADLRVEDGAGNNYIVRGSWGSMSVFSTDTGTDHAIRERQVNGSAVHFVEVEFTANQTGSYILKADTNSTTNGHTLKLLDVDMWCGASANTLTYTATLDKPDTIAPQLQNCDIAEQSGSSATLGCVTNELGGTFYAVITDSATAPSSAQIKAGQDDSGSPALYATSQTVSGDTILITASSLNPYVDKYAYFLHQDAAGNDSIVYASETFITGEEQPAGTVKKFVWSTDYDGLGTDNRVVHNGELLTTSVDLVVQCRGSNSPALYYGDQSKPDALFYDDNVPFTNGTGQITEVDLSVIGGGSINQLTVGDYYWLDCWSQKVALINNITKSNPALITATGHGFETGAPVFIQGISGMTELNGKEFTATVLDANNFSINIDSTGFNTYSSGGTASGLYDVRFGDRYKLVEEAIE